VVLPHNSLRHDLYESVDITIIDAVYESGSHPQRALVILTASPYCGHGQFELQQQRRARGMLFARLGGNESERRGHRRQVRVNLYTFDT